MTSRLVQTSWQLHLICLRADSRRGLSILSGRNLAGVVSQISKFLDANPKEIPVKPTRVVSDDDESNETQVLESKEEIVSEKDEKLDPPRGMGLKFDEIEKMIDQVLSQTKES